MLVLFYQDFQLRGLRRYVVYTHVTIIADKISIKSIFTATHPLQIFRDLRILLCFTKSKQPAEKE